MNPPIPKPNQVPPAPTAQTSQGTAFTNATVPKAPTEVKERIITDSEIVARPLTSPNFLDMKPKNPNMKCRWGNRSVGDKESKMRIHELIARGFRVAKPAEVQCMDGTEVPESLLINDQIIYGDLMLLIIPRQMYDGAIKFNEQTARLRVAKRGIGSEQRDQEEIISRAAHGKVAFYEPDSKSTEVLVGAHLDKKQ